jgi:hypothetical protein
MPTTINGVGTRYGGKSNVETFFGVCESCRREVHLSNYETKLWFTVFVVPLIPLGKKQIFNYCPSCTRHGAMPLEQWQGIKQNAVEEQRTAWNQTGDPAAAIQLLETYAAFRQFDEGRDLAGTMASRFPNVTNVQLAIGQFYATVDQNEDSERCFRKAYELDSTSPHARHALAIYALQKDDPVSAERLLRQQPPITAADNPQLHYMLGAAYHSQGRNAEALQTFRAVLEAAPQFGKNKAVRKLIRETELAVGEQDSILQYQPFYRTTPFLVTAGIVLLLAVGLGWNWSVSCNRTLHIVNGYKSPITVTLDGGQNITVTSQERSQLKLSEGKHRATVQREGHDPETIDFDVSASFWDRYFKSPVFVLNPGGAAPLMWEQTTYAAGGGGVNPYRFQINQPFVTYPDLDYSFAPFPATLEVRKNERRTKVRIDLAPVDPAALIVFEESIPDDEKLKYAEAHLRDDPSNRSLLWQYIALAQKVNQADRAMKFLEAGLDHRPLAVDWHRAYQHFRLAAGGGPELIDEYRRRLAADPSNAALMYLVGRLEPRQDNALKLYGESIAADPKLFYPKYAKASVLLSSGEFAAARPLAEEALALDPQNAEAQDVCFKLQLANRDYAALEAQLRDKIQSEPLGFLSRLKLMYVLAANNQFNELDQLNDRFQQALAADPLSPSMKEQVAKTVRQAAMYLQRRLQQLLSDGSEASPENALVRFAALLELDQLDQAGAALHSAPAGADKRYFALCLATAWRQRGKDTLAQLWESTACELLAAAVDTESIAQAIQRPGKIDLAEIIQTNSQPHEKAVLLTALAYRCGDQKQQALELARKLNFQMEFPHYFLEGAIAAEEGRK